MNTAHDNPDEIDSVCPHGPDEEHPEALEYAEAIHTNGMVGLLYSRFHSGTEYIQADVETFVEVPEWR